MGGWLRELVPGARVGGENTERFSLPGQDFVTLMDGDVLLRMYFRAERSSNAGDFFLHSPAEWIGVAIEENGFGPRFNEEFPEFLIGGALAKDEAAAELFEISRESFQAAAKELLARRAGPPVPGPPIAQHVNGNYLRGRLESGAKGGVVVQAQVAAKPMDDALHERPNGGIRRGLERIRALT